MSDPQRIDSQKPGQEQKPGSQPNQPVQQKQQDPERTAQESTVGTRQTQ
jgi:hypothetical protein